MSDVLYCEPEDVYDYAIPRGVLASQARAVASVNTTSNVLELAGHGFKSDATVEFRAFNGGELPGGLAAQTVYYAQPVSGSDSLFKISATASGSAIDLTSEGDNFGCVSNIRSTITENIRAASQELHRFLPAHSVPIPALADGTYPPIVRRIVAVWATYGTMLALGQHAERVAAEVAQIYDRVKLLLAGVPMRDTTDTSSRINLALSGSAVSACSETIP